MSQQTQEAEGYALLSAELSALAAHLEGKAPPSACLESGPLCGAGMAEPGRSMDAQVKAPPVCYPILDRIAEKFDLSPFERAIVLAAAGLELDSAFTGRLAAVAPGEVPLLTFGLALARLPQPHWSAIGASAPLRRNRLIYWGDGFQLVSRPVYLCEPVLHALAGVESWDPRLDQLVRLVEPPEQLPQSQSQVAGALEQLWLDPAPRAAIRSPQTLPILCGCDLQTRRKVAAVAAQALGMRLSVLDLEALPSSAEARAEVARIWTRDVALYGAAMLVEVADARDPDALRFVEQLSGPAALSSDRPNSTGHGRGGRPPVRLDLRPPTRAEQLGLWRQVLGAEAGRYQGAVERVVDQFCLGPEEIESAAAGLPTVGHATDPVAALWYSCRVQSRPSMEGLAERVPCHGSWDDLVLPQVSLTALRAIVAHVRQRERVYQSWGYGRAGARGLGVTALFSGPSGTGKTLAAEVVSRALDLDLYRVDLSRVVSKYIGETEKHLQQIFDAAERGGVVLLFDEADALFGKRSEVRDAHDRYANIEVSYLLQRIESFRGLAVLTTNLRSSMDDAFLRRIRFAIDFPFPDGTQRSEIWRRAFPPDTPIADLDFDRLSDIQLCGGNIRNVALGAAFLAADAGMSVMMEHVIEAARAEFVKLERPFVVPTGWRARQPANPKPIGSGMNRGSA